MDQGYQQVPRRVASGYFSLIFFIVLCLALIGGYVPLVLNFQQKSQDLARINELIDGKLYRPLTSKGATTLQRQRPTEGTTLVWGSEFFDELQTLAARGYDYSLLTNKVGWPRPDTVLEDIQAKLDDISPRQPNLKELVEMLQGERTELTARVDRLARDLADAQKGQQDALRQRKEAEHKFQQSIDQLQAEVDAIRKDARAEVAEFKKKWTETHEQYIETREQAENQREAFKGTREKLETQISELEREVAKLRAELAGPAEAAKKGPVGKVQLTELVHNFVILNRGTNDGVEEGRELFVFRAGPAGEKQYVGKVVVVSAENLVSQANVLDQDEMNPIMRGDLLFPAPAEGEEVTPGE